MEDLYIQKFGGCERIVAIASWGSRDVLLEDLRTGLKYPMLWNLFFKFCKKIEPMKIDISEYKGSILDDYLTM